MSLNMESQVSHGKHHSCEDRNSVKDSKSGNLGGSHQQPSSMDGTSSDDAGESDADEEDSMELAPSNSSNGRSRKTFPPRLGEEGSKTKHDGKALRRPSRRQKESGTTGRRFHQRDPIESDSEGDDDEEIEASRHQLGRLKVTPEGKPRRVTTVKSDGLSGMTDDDDDYAGVDLISESEDGSHVEHTEEKLIIDSFVGEGDSSRRASFSSFGSDWVSNEAGLLLDDFPSHEQQFDLDDHSDIFDFGSSNTARGAAGRKRRESSARRVHFEDQLCGENTSSTADSDLESTIFPDLFLHQETLDPTFRQMIENDADADMGDFTGSDGENSYWDYSGDVELGPRDWHDVHTASEGSDATSGGYESMVVEGVDVL